MHYTLIFAAHDNEEKLLLSKQWLFFADNILDARTEAIKKAKGLTQIFYSKQYDLLTHEGFIAFDIDLMNEAKNYHVSLHFVHSNGIAVEIFGDKKWALYNLQEEASILSKVCVFETTDVQTDGSIFRILKDDSEFLTAPNG